MKTKRLLELLTLSSSIYYIVKDTHLIEKFNELSQKSKDEINRMASEIELDDDGNELEFLDKIILKTSQAKEEIEQKIEELIVKFYKKMNIAQIDEIEALNKKLEKANDAIALLEARINHLETKV
ncbi:hypothetical protein [Gaetbulibacter saemankumensis]|uniref:hypothetical protein n=1 Tax=Gaetbulibacter saemankumensis TaxID=311208 RepID=UPI000489855B|nr:hypothetical protein [Gaetbulibacter saemankumensis]